jgi:uncharacterized protein
MSMSQLGMVRRRLLLKGAAVIGASAVTSSVAGQTNLETTQMADDLTADELLKLLQLEPNATCGFVRVSFSSKQSLAKGTLSAPFEDERPLGSALYFMVTPGAPVRLHRIRNDQLYHYYLGDPLETILLHGDRSIERVIVGPDLRRGHRVQLLIPGNTFHTARLMGRSRWFLGASTEWPGVIPADVELGKLEELVSKYPAAAADLRAIAASVQHGAAEGVGPR